MSSRIQCTPFYLFIPSFRHKDTDLSSMEDAMIHLSLSLRIPLANPILPSIDNRRRSLFLNPIATSCVFLLYLVFFTKQSGFFNSWSALLSVVAALGRGAEKDEHYTESGELSQSRCSSGSKRETEHSSNQRNEQGGLLIRPYSVLKMSKYIITSP